MTIWAKEKQNTDTSCHTRPNHKMRHLSMTYLAFDGVICEDIKQLVEDFEPGQVAERMKKRHFVFSQSNALLCW